MADITYTNFDPHEDIVYSTKRKISTGMWQGGQPVISKFYAYATNGANAYKGYGTSLSNTSIMSDFATQKEALFNLICGSKYYLDVYSENVDNPYVEAEPAFSISYGNMNGLGSKSDDYDQPTKAIYLAMKNILDGIQEFIMDDNDEPLDDFYAIVINKNRLKEMLDPGNWSLNFGSVTLVDDSNESNTAEAKNNHYGVYVADAGTTDPNVDKQVGFMFPKHGVILLKPSRLVANGISVQPDLSTDKYTFNPGKLFDYFISSGANFVARSAETVISTNYFVRIKNKMYNRTYNNSIITNGIVKQEFLKEPKTFVTGVGLYGGNDGYQLVAIAKLNKPILKTPDTEALIRIRMDF